MLFNQLPISGQGKTFRQILTSSLLFDELLGVNNLSKSNPSFSLIKLCYSVTTSASP